MEEVQISADKPEGALDRVKDMAKTPQFLAWTALAFMTVSSVASLRPAPTMAVYGLTSAFSAQKESPGENCDNNQYSLCGRTEYRRTARREECGIIQRFQAAFAKNVRDG